MPIQVDPPSKADRLVPAVGLGVLVVLGLVIATNWRALILVVVILAAVAGWWIRG